MIVTRFAPSPTGYLHLGHAYAALFAWHTATDEGGRFLLRIEDIDAGRARADFEAALLDDLAWLGLDWPAPVRRQSEHFDDYRAALDRLAAQDLLYPCFCTRADIRAEIERAGAAPHATSHGPDGAPLYPGTCRALDASLRAERIAAGAPHALRLDVARASAQAGPLRWHDCVQGDIVARPAIFGDVVLARRDTPASYHLAVTLDDHLQGVTLVTRGEDLFESTHVHRLLQALLGLDVPDYHHHRLLLDDTGKRFAKRDRAVSLRDLRARGATPAEVRALAGFPD
jgi:glutamyl-Q tRNA(Asp) synthetase